MEYVNDVRDVNNEDDIIRIAAFRLKTRNI